MKVSISRIKTFKACRRAYYLKYVEELTPVDTAETLATGKKYHEMIEAFHKGETVEPEFTKEYAMFQAYRTFLAPFIPEDMESEVDFSIGVGDDEFIGRADGYCPRSKTIIEHKTVSAELTDEYEYDLQWDEQILAYMLAFASLSMIYTVVRKPTIRQKKDESDEDYFHRMEAWYHEDTPSKVRVFMVERTEEEVAEFSKELSNIITTIKCAEANEEFYKNTLHCFRWGRRCEYAPVCLHYDKDAEYIEFRKGDRYGTGTEENNE